MSGAISSAVRMTFQKEKGRIQSPETTEDGPELWQVEALLSAMGLPRPKKIGRGPRPEPDVVFINADGGAMIGVEVTEIHPSGTEERRREEEANGVVEEAKRRFEAEGYPQLMVSVFWSATNFFPKRDRETLITALVESVRTFMPKDSKRVEVDQCDDSPPALPGTIDRLSINRLPGIPSHWQCPRALYVPDIQVSDIEDALAKKNQKVSNYRGGYNSRWLLIVGSGSGPSTWGLIRPHLANASFRSSYDRVFLMSRLERTFLELTVSAAGTL